MERQLEERRLRLALFEDGRWDDRRVVVREEMDRYDIKNLDLTIWLRDHGVRTARGPVSLETVGRWLRGPEGPPQKAMDAVIDMLVAAATGEWSKARYLSWTRVVDAIRPRFAPQAAYSIAEFSPLRVAY